MLLSEKKDHKTYSVGLDISLTSTGVYTFPINHDEWYGWALQSTVTEGNDTSRVISMSDDILDALRSLPHTPAIAVFEDYGPINRTSGKVAQRAEICGILKYHLLYEFQIPVVAISPPSLKSFATGNGKAPKKQIIDRSNQLGYFPETSDEADAYFAARLGWKIFAGEKTGAAFHRTNPMNRIPYNQS